MGEENPVKVVKMAMVEEGMVVWMAADIQAMVEEVTKEGKMAAEVMVMVTVEEMGAEEVAA